MTVNRKVTGKAASVPSGLAVSAAISMLITLIIVAIGAYMISNGILPQEQIGYCSMTALLAGSMAGSIMAARKIKHQKLVTGLLSGAIYYLILLAITALFFGGQYQGMGVTLLLVMGGSAIGAILANRKPKMRTPYGRKKINR